MLYYALVFLVIALIAGVLGFSGIAGASAGIAQILFFLFLAFLVISLVIGFIRRAGPGRSTHDCPAIRPRPKRGRMRQGLVNVSIVHAPWADRAVSAGEASRLDRRPA